MKFKLGRKFTSAMAVALLATINDAAGFGISEETILIVAGLVGVFILGESAADAASALGKDKTLIEKTGAAPKKGDA